MNAEVVLPADADRETWLAERRRGICSSDVAALAGLDQFGTALSVYLDKRGLLPERPVNPSMAWGTRLEPLIAEAYAERTRRQLQIPPKLIRSLALPYMLASLDRLTEDQERIVELKYARTSEGWGQDGTDEIPARVRLQVEHQMLTAGIFEADVAVLIGGSDFRVYPLTQNPTLSVQVGTIEQAFWDGFSDGTAPEPDWQHPTTPALLASLHGTADGEIDLGLEHIADAFAYRELGERIKQLDVEREQCKARLLYAMGDAALAHLPDGTELHRRPTNRKSYEVKATTYVAFSLKPPKDRT